MNGIRFVALGFDVRAPWSVEWARTWDARRRRIFLLNEDVECPLSVDRNVWPALGIDETFFSPDETPLWRNRELMISRLSERVPGWDRWATEIAIDAIEDSEKQNHFDKRFDILTCSAIRDEEYEILGYDIADISLTSALSNCGFDQSEKSLFQKEFCSNLNEHGLFIRHDSAIRFCMLSDRRLSEHSPFFVYRIRRKRMEYSKNQVVKVSDQIRS